MGERNPSEALREMDARVLDWWAQHWADDTGGEDPRNVYDEPPEFVTPALERAGLSQYDGTSKIEAAMQRALAPASPAPAWTREAPASDGWYFARCAEWKIEPERGRALLWTAENAWRCGWELGCCEEPPEAPIEHWPQRLDPPR